MTNFEFGLMYKDKGDTNAAKKAFKEALETFKKLGANKEMAEVNKEL